MLIPLAGVMWGPPGALGCLAASLAGDAFGGMWGGLTPYRAAGHFLFAMTAHKLWELHALWSIEHARPHPRWASALRFLLIVWPGCFVDAVWPALGADRADLYPFPYFATILLLNHLVFVTVLGPALYRIASRELIPWLGSWRDVMRRKPQWSRWTGVGPMLVLIGAMGAWLVGVSGSARAGIAVFDSHIIGTGAPRGVIAAVMAFLILQVAGIFWPWQSRWKVDKEHVGEQASEQREES